MVGGYLFVEGKQIIPRRYPVKNKKSLPRGGKGI